MPGHGKDEKSELVTSGSCCPLGCRTWIIQMVEWTDTFQPPWRIVVPTDHSLRSEYAPIGIGSQSVRSYAMK